MWFARRPPRLPAGGAGKGGQEGDSGARLRTAADQGARRGRIQPGSFCGGAGGATGSKASGDGAAASFAGKGAGGPGEGSVQMRGSQADGQGGDHQAGRRRHGAGGDRARGEGAQGDARSLVRPPRAPTTSPPGETPAHRSICMPICYDQRADPFACQYVATSAPIRLHANMLRPARRSVCTSRCYDQHADPFACQYDKVTSFSTSARLYGSSLRVIS
eukprot:2891764-Pyramimonas_sp.AAC.1